MFRFNKKNKDQINLPDEVLLNIFSLFKTPQPSTLLVCKQWNEVGNDESLWRSYIKPEYLPQLQNLQLTAKEFYKQNKEARKFSAWVYFITSPVSKNDEERDKLFSHFVNGIKVELKSNELNLFRYNNSYFPAFLMLSDAKMCVISIYNLILDHDLEHEYRAPLIFSAHVDNVDQLQMTKEVYSIPYFDRSDFALYQHQFSCFRISPSTMSLAAFVYPMKNSFFHKTSLNIIEEPEATKSCTPSCNMM